MGSVQSQVRVSVEVSQIEGGIPMKVVFLRLGRIRPDEPSNIPSFSASDVCHEPLSVRAKDDAPENISFMLITRDTSH